MWVAGGMGYVVPFLLEEQKVWLEAEISDW
jgi:hypothetical protein